MVFLRTLGPLLLPLLCSVTAQQLAHLRYPKQHAAFHLQPDEGLIEIDGLLDDTAWERVAYTTPFVDIQGPLHWSQPWLTTRVKMRYDHEILYIGAYLEETAIWANQSQRNSVIFHDNDFEVFVDADGSTHNYKEIEVNARNASWNLLLNKPYRSGGHENSTRVDPLHGFDMVGKGFQCAVHFDGAINDPAQKLHYWTVEMALPLKELARYTRVKTLPPPARSLWRINFSRVEWQVRVVTSDDGRHQQFEKLPGVAESNWVWSPQYAVDMHRPEWWGLVEFRDPSERPPLDPSAVVVSPDDTWMVRYVAFQLFYAQEAFKSVHGRYAAYCDEEVRTLFPDQEVVARVSYCAIQSKDGGASYRANIKYYKRNEIATIQSDGLFTIGSVMSIEEDAAVMSVE